MYLLHMFICVIGLLYEFAGITGTCVFVKLEVDARRALVVRCLTEYLGEGAEELVKDYKVFYDYNFILGLQE